MKKIVINGCFGGFSLSHKAVMRYAELKGFKLYASDYTRDAQGNLNLNKHKPWDGVGSSMFIHYSKKPLKPDGTLIEKSYFSSSDIERDDETLIKVIQEMKGKASGQCAQLEIVEIPDDVDWVINEYDGNEHIAEKHRTWS